MINRKSILILFLFPLLLTAQTTSIGMAKSGTRLLIFPNDIDFTILGDKYNFVEVLFSNNGSKYGDRIMGLQISGSATGDSFKTNYSVITKDGELYEFSLFFDPNSDNKTLKISKEQSSMSLDKRAKGKGLSKLLKETESYGDTILPKVHYYKNTKAISDPEKPLDENETELPLTEDLYETDKEEYFRRKCYYNQFKKGSIVKYFARKDNVFLWLKEVYYNHNELYFLFRLENKETIDYDIRLIRTSIGTNYKKSSSNQKTPFPPDFKYKVPKRVKGNTSNYFFLVYDKFTLDKNKDLVVQLDEINGNRNITLKIDRTKVNRPKRF